MPGFYTQTPEGNTIHINGDPNMSAETAEALGRMMDAARKWYEQKEKGMDKKVTKEQLKNVVRANSDLFTMHTFGVKTSCGTAYCLAGWTLVLAGYETVLDGQYIEFLNDAGKIIEYPSAEAAKVLGINSTDMFFMHQWPWSIRNMQSETQEQYIEQACTAIDYFFAQDAVEA